MQLLASHGVPTTAVCPEEHAALVQGLGASRVLGLSDFPEPDRRYDVVFDAVGKSSFTTCRSALQPRGRYLTTDFGPRAQNPFFAALTAVTPGRRAIICKGPFGGVTRLWDSPMNLGFVGIVIERILPRQCSRIKGADFSQVFLDFMREKDDP